MQIIRKNPVVGIKITDDGQAAWSGQNGVNFQVRSVFFETRQDFPGIADIVSIDALAE